jgi:hypothetical protein
MASTTYRSPFDVTVKLLTSCRKPIVSLRDRGEYFAMWLLKQLTPLYSEPKESLDCLPARKYI